MTGVEQWLKGSEGEWSYVILFISSFVENIFPPFPGDSVVVLGAFFVGKQVLSFFPVYLSTVFGSTFGFYFYYLVGMKFGRRIFQNPSGKWFSIKQLEKVEAWYDRYGYWIIATNRFLAGFRSVVALGAGIGKMEPHKVMALAFLSCAVWNGILIFGGIQIGKQWAKIVQYYQYIIGIIILGILCFIGIKTKLRKKK